MTAYNMSIKAGARAGMVAPGEMTFEYFKDCPHAPEGEEQERVVEYQKALPPDEDAVPDAEVILEAVDIEPFITWGTNPGQSVPLFSKVPDPKDFSNGSQRPAVERTLEYMDLEVGTAMCDICIDTVFLDSRTNGHIEDLRAAAAIIEGRKEADSVRMLVVPDSAQARLRAEAEGLDRTLTEFGTE